MYLPAFLLLLGVTATFFTTTTPATTEEPPRHVSCKYWCIYIGPYCCDDGSLTDHLPHSHLVCPAVDEQICKSTGIFLNNTSPALVLAKGDPKKQVWCASDGYCQEDQRCCPSPCVRRHLCMAGLKREEAVEQEEEGYLLEEEKA